MGNKNLNGRITPKGDIEANWKKATGFVPEKKELIIYLPDENYNYSRMKIGDGISNVNDLPFLTVEIDQEYSPESENPQSGRAVSQAVEELKKSFVGDVNVEPESWSENKCSLYIDEFDDRDLIVFSPKTKEDNLVIVDFEVSVTSKKNEIILCCGEHPDKALCLTYYIVKNCYPETIAYLITVDVTQAPGVSVSFASGSESVEAGESVSLNFENYNSLNMAVLGKAENETELYRWGANNIQSNVDFKVVEGKCPIWFMELTSEDELWILSHHIVTEDGYRVLSIVDELFEADGIEIQSMVAREGEQFRFKLFSSDGVEEDNYAIYLESFGTAERIGELVKDEDGFFVIPELLKDDSGYYVVVENKSYYLYPEDPWLAIAHKITEEA